jgi:hypothetical protein
MRIDVSGHSFVFPNRCACCSGTPSTSLPISASRSTGKRVVHTKTNVWDIPYCAQCIAHVKAAENTKLLAWALGIASVVIGVLMAFSNDSPAPGFVTGLIGLTLTVVVYRYGMTKARALCSAQCACVGKAVGYLGWHGTLHQFEVSSPSFARDFLTSNERKLVNLSNEARSLLASTGAIPKSNVPRSPRRYRT